MDLTDHSVIWSGMAAELRTAAAQVDDPGLRRRMLGLAAKYEFLARNAEASAQRSAAANSNEPSQDAST
jgi:hypothetical protein